jgi:FKBP-type peptidyl-prolyl cis-trans isomerase FkpA
MSFRLVLVSCLALALVLACSESSNAAGDTYKVEQIKEGTGKQPTATSVVVVHYHGTLADGTVFDSSKQRGKPATFPLNRVIKCWTDGLQTMKEGGSAKLTCPADVAYGKAGRPPKIPANATLYFDVDLLEVK